MTIKAFLNLMISLTVYLCITSSTQAQETTKAYANSPYKKIASDKSIINGSDWFDTDGRQISAHEGEIARFGDTFYWYGSSYKNNPKGRFRMTAGPVWNGMQVYSSKD